MITMPNSDLGRAVLGDLTYRIVIATPALIKKGPHTIVGHFAMC